MAEFGSLTIIGVIATILSIGFAFAAFVNSRRRATDQNESAEKTDAPHLPFLAIKEQPKQDKQARQTSFYNVADHQTAAQGQTKPAFNQMQVLGTQSAQRGSSSSDEYLWE
jgi:hypothetical protein